MPIAGWWPVFQIYYVFRNVSSFFYRAMHYSKSLHHALIAVVQMLLFAAIWNRVRIFDRSSDRTRSVVEHCWAMMGDRLYNSSAVAEMGDRGHNRHGPKRGGGCYAPFAGAGTPYTTWPGLRSTSIPSGILMQRVV